MAGLFKTKSADSQKYSEDAAVYSPDAVYTPEGGSEADVETLPGRKQIGLFSAIFIIFNRIIGTG